MKWYNEENPNMVSVENAYLAELDRLGFPQLAQLWQPFVTQETTLYQLSDPGYGPRDTYAISSLCRYLPPSIELKTIPVSPGGLHEVANTNLIIVGQIQDFGSQSLADETRNAVVQDYARFRFLDHERLLNIENGIIYPRVESGWWAKDHGVIRIWRQTDNNHTIMHLAGLGAIGTLGAALAITDLKNSAANQLEKQLSETPNFHDEFVEIIIATERQVVEGDDLVVVSPAQLTSQVATVIVGLEKPDLPQLHFHTPRGKENHRITVTSSKNKPGQSLEVSPAEFAVLSAIAEHTNQTPSLFFTTSGGYITYEEIFQSETQQLSPDIQVIRTTVARLTQKLNSINFQRNFPNFLLKSSISQAAGRPRTGLRLRATASFS